MARDNDRENLTEMEQIHRGLEAFLEKEVYEEYGDGPDAGPEIYGPDADRDGYEYGDEVYGDGEYGNEEYEDQEYGNGEYEDEVYEGDEYEDEEPVRGAMGRQGMLQAGGGGKVRNVQTQTGCSRPFPGLMGVRFLPLARDCVPRPFPPA